MYTHKIVVLLHRSKTNGPVSMRLNKSAHTILLVGNATLVDWMRRESTLWDGQATSGTHAGRWSCKHPLPNVRRKTQSWTGSGNRTSWKHSSLHNRSLEGGGTWSAGLMWATYIVSEELYIQSTRRQCFMRPYIMLPFNRLDVFFMENRTENQSKIW